MTEGIKLELHIDEVKAEMVRIMRSRMIESVNAVRSQALEVLSGPRHGHTYKVPGTKIPYTASAPREAPATATGQLRQSVKYSVEGNGMDLVGKVGTDLEKGKQLEFGTRKMKARPWLRVSFEKANDKVKSIWNRKWF